MHLPLRLVSGLMVPAPQHYSWCCPSRTHQCHAMHELPHALSKTVGAGAPRCHAQQRNKRSAVTVLHWREDQGIRGETAIKLGGDTEGPRENSEEHTALKSQERGQRSFLACVQAEAGAQRRAPQPPGHHKRPHSFTVIFANGLLKARCATSARLSPARQAAAATDAGRHNLGR